MAESLSLRTAKTSRKAYPRPCPRGGDTPSCEDALCSPLFYRGFATWRHPRLRSVLWLAQQLPVGSAALAKNLPHRSRENEFTDGRVGRFWEEKDDVSFTGTNGLHEWAAGA